MASSPPISLHENAYLNQPEIMEDRQNVPNLNDYQSFGAEDELDKVTNKMSELASQTYYG